MSRYVTGFGKTINMQFMQYINFLVPHVKNCQSPDFVIYMLTLLIVTSRLVVSYKGLHLIHL